MIELIITSVTLAQDSPYWCIVEISLIALCALTVLQGLLEGVISVRGAAVYKYDNPIGFVVIQGLICLIIILVLVKGSCNFLSF